MADKTVASPPKASGEKSQAADGPVIIPLRVFADTHCLKYGIEIMAGFFHAQEVQKHYADTEENWHKLLNEFKGKEVK